MGKTRTREIISPVRIDFAGGTTDISPFKDKYGGCVLNAAINRYVAGKIVKGEKKTYLEYTGNVPTSSGLGTSGVMNLVWLGLISHKEKLDKKELAEKVYRMEQSTGLVGGKQDQYASAFGGINFIEFNKEQVKVERLNLPKSFIRKLENNLILVYTGKPHFSGDLNHAMISGLKVGKNVLNLLNIKNIAIEMRKAFLDRNLKKIAELMNESTEERRKLHKNVIPEDIQKIIDEGMENGAIAAKICGSGGGGSILFIGDKKKLKSRFKSKAIDFRFDFKGLRIHNS